MVTTGVASQEEEATSRLTLRDRLRNWLGIEEPIEPKLNKELEKKVAQLNKDLDFWHKTFRSFSVLPCGHCGEQMRVYPYGGAYYTRDGKKIHAHCYDNYLKENA